MAEEVGKRVQQFSQRTTSPPTSPHNGRGQLVGLVFLLKRKDVTVWVKSVLMGMNATQLQD